MGELCVLEAWCDSGNVGDVHVVDALGYVGGLGEFAVVNALGDVDGVKYLVMCMRWVLRALWMLWMVWASSAHGLVLGECMMNAGGGGTTHNVVVDTPRPHVLQL